LQYKDNQRIHHEHDINLLT